MKNQQPTRENTEGELRHYLHERPNLLLKMPPAYPCLPFYPPSR